VDRDRQGNGRSALTSPPPRAEDRVDAPAGPFAPEEQVGAPTRSRRFARPATDAPPLAPPPRPAQAADTLFMPPPDAAHRVIPAPDPGQRVGAAVFPPPLAEHRIPSAAPRRRRPLPGPPWLGPALLAALGVLLIGAGIGLGAHEIFGGKHHRKAPAAQATPSRRSPVPLTPTRPTGPTTPSGPATVSPGGTTAGKKGGRSKAVPLTPGTGAANKPSGTGGGISSWPAGKTAWTVVLSSAKSKSAAESKARQASGRGIGSGVLNSNDFSSLRHGYWVAFAGQYGSSADAASAAKRYASQGFGGAYPRFVKP